MQRDDQARRHRTERYLRNVDYPVAKNELVELAQDSGAPNDVLAALGKIEDRRYTSPADVEKALRR